MVARLRRVRLVRGVDGGEHRRTADGAARLEFRGVRDGDRALHERMLRVLLLLLLLVLLLRRRVVLGCGTRELAEAREGVRRRCLGRVLQVVLARGEERLETILPVAIGTDEGVVFWLQTHVSG